MRMRPRENLNSFHVVGPLGKVVKLQMKLDTIEKHVAKVYDKKAANDENKSTARWKYVNEC